MHVAVLGAGALGALYGVRLAVRAGVDVTFVVRPSRASETTPLVLEGVAGGGRDELAHPVRRTQVPDDADVVLVAVGTEELEAIRALVGERDVPVVVLTPMLPADFARMKDAFGARVLAAMPAVVSYVRHEDGVVRAWFPPRATLIDEPRAGESAEVVHALVRALREARLPAELELGVHEKNPATTVGFIGAAMAIAVAGSLEALADDDALLALAARSCREGREIGRRIGRADPLAALGASLASPLALRVGIGALRRLSPEAAFYAEEHFGRKLRAQHVVMAREIAALARDKGLPGDAFEELARRLEHAPAEGRAGTTGKR